MDGECSSPDTDNGGRIVTHTELDRLNSGIQESQVKNKALVLEAFETLFNRRDYAAAESFWSPSTFSIALIFRPVGTVSLPWSEMRART